MHTFTRKADLRKELKVARASGKSIGLVPTMGSLHSGHLELVKTAKAKSDHVVCSIFVNPLQFGPNEDLEAYPRSLADDQKKLIAEGCACLYAPSVTEIYGLNLSNQTLIHVPGLSDIFCGSSRPGHFSGVATIVSKLFNIVQPDSAYFGLKDYQQFLIIQKLAQDLSHDIVIVGVETQREESGLALSSRNNYLSSEQRKNASLIYQCLVETAKKVKHGGVNFSILEEAAKDRLIDAGIEPEFFSICNAENLQIATELDRQIVILVAAQVGPSRLIDNILVELNP